jgi:hypothetical protein
MPPAVSYAPVHIFDMLLCPMRLAHNGSSAVEQAGFAITQSMSPWHCVPQEVSYILALQVVHTMLAHAALVQSQLPLPTPPLPPPAPPVPAAPAVFAAPPLLLPPLPPVVDEAPPNGELPPVLVPVPPLPRTELPVPAFGMELPVPALFMLLPVPPLDREPLLPGAPLEFCDRPPLEGASVLAGTAHAPDSKTPRAMAARDETRDWRDTRTADTLRDNLRQRVAQ